MSIESTSPEVIERSEDMIQQFHHIAAQFGFTQPIWDYDSDLGLVRVQFEDTSRGKTLQIDYHVQDDSYSPNYCRAEKEWLICAEGKPKSLRGLKATLSRWLLKHCEECRSAPEPVDEPQ